MSIFRNSDVKNHLSLRFRARTYLNMRANRPNASDHSLTNPDAIGIIPEPFAMDYSAEHTIAGLASPLTSDSIDSSESQEPDTSKSAQA